MSEEAELDYDDPSFLLDVAPSSTSTATLSYAERRQQKLKATQQKILLNTQPRTGRLAEIQRREEGLAKNLITHRDEGDTEGEGESKALKMMRLMGFTPGDGLGKRDLTTAIDEEGGETIPATTASTSRTEPLAFEIRQGRTGLGIPSLTKRARLSRPSPSSSSSSTHPVVDPTPSYLSHNRSQFNDKRILGLLHSVRKTVRELDERNGIEGNLMGVEERNESERNGEERRERIRRAGIRGGEVDLDDDDVQTDTTEQGILGYDKGFSDTVVEEDEEDQENEGEEIRNAEQDWFALDPAIRLAATLGYLRSSYSYCFWCGCGYSDLSELTLECPGELEDDH